MTDLKIRQASADDAGFLAWAILTAGRAHVQKGIWEVILGAPEEPCLHFLKKLSITGPPHPFHYSCYLLAEMNGCQAACLGGYDPVSSGYEALSQALATFNQALEGSAPKATVNGKRPRILDCIPEAVDGAWVIDSVASVRDFRRKGIVGKILEEILQRGRARGFKCAQVNVYIGNTAAQRLYEKHGFSTVEEIRDPYFESQIGAPGMACMLRNL